MAKLFALIDCNNFYVSCERLFRPELHGRPVVVLSNNDGCIIARSNEAKALGIAMATPYFKVREELQRRGVTVFSSNYALYGDLSQRVMTTLREMEPRVEVYSIDEAFVSLAGSDTCAGAEQAARIRERIARHVGITVSIGIGPSKTLAKIANRIAKKEACRRGIFVFPAEPDKGDMLLADLDVGEVWGIGRRSRAKLARHGMTTALQLKKADQQWLGKQLTVTGARTALELAGISCINLEQAPPARRSILSSRSFKRPVRSLVELKEAVATYTARAAVKLRGQELTSGALQVFIATSRFAKDQPAHADSRTITLPIATCHTPTLISSALQALATIYRPGLRYQKAGVMLTDLGSRGRRQANLFMRPAPQGPALMSALDQINRRWGRNTLHYGAEGIGKPWSMRRDFKSPAYTTSWQELPVAHCR
ncbi:MAG: SOS mutagenesis and repair protein UmuC [Desulfobulbaceae bacterium]|nr:MAG: SOS mutagenesis and repair protein UmuC [Desulfobulbaceae bacterium]